MLSNSKINELKNGLPYGGFKELIKRTGLTRVTIFKIFNGKPAKMQNVIKVVKESEKIIAEYKELTGQNPTV